MNQQMVLPEGGLASFITSNMDEFDDSRLLFGRQNGINSMRDTAERMAKMGRNGDVHIAHLQQGEGVVPREVLENNPELAQEIGLAISAEGADPSAYIVGSESNSINPYTGQREFFLKKLVSGVKNVLKAVAPIVVPMALNFFAPGLGTVASGFIGGGITALAQGASFKDSIKAGLIGGAIGGITSGFKGVFSDAQGNFAQKFSQGFKQGAMPTPGNILRSDTNPGYFLSREFDVEAANKAIQGPPTTMDKVLQTAQDAFYTPATDGMTATQAGQLAADAKMTSTTPGYAKFISEKMAGTPGGIRLLPTAAAGLGVAALAGGFDPIEPAEVPDPYEGPSQSEERLAENPDKYRTGVAPQPTYLTVADTIIPTRPAPFRPVFDFDYEKYLQPVAAAAGGEMSFPRRNGYISGPGTETSDDIPAMLSDGEFVMTAQAVRGLGNGSRKDGVRKMYDMMRAFEGGAVA
jgi:hypothetical protein